MRVLIVGAGAVGQVYAYYLMKGGADVSFYCKEKYKTELEKGVDIFQHGIMDKLLFAKPKKRTLGKFGIVTNTAELQQQHFDYIIITVSSTALRSGWLAEFAQAISDSIVVNLHVAMEDGDYIKRYCKESNYCKGLIQFVSYQSPLPGIDQELGLHYFLPPIAGLFDGNKSEALSRVLNRGGFKNRLKKNLEEHSALIGTMSIPLIASLQLFQWRLKTFARSEESVLGLSAGAEAKAVTLSSFSDSRVKMVRPMNVYLVSLLLSLAQVLSPFDFEKFIAYHFNKVSDQTLLMLKNYQKSGEKYAVATPAINKIIQRLEAM